MKNKGYFNESCYEDCEKEIKKKIKCRVKRLIYLKKLKKVRCNKFFENNFNFFDERKYTEKEKEEKERKG